MLSDDALDADPRDLVSLTNYGASQTMVTFDDLSQMRDYSDTTVVATIEDIERTAPYEPPYVTDGLLRVNTRVEAVLGGRFTHVEAGQDLEISIPHAATAEVLDTLLPRLERLTTSGLRFVLFLRAVPSSADPDSIDLVPMNIDGPRGVLAEWPGDGRVTNLAPHDDIYRPAMERGEELTGTSSPPEATWQPTFEGPSPIGLTVEELIDEFKGTPGEPRVEPPTGWEDLEPLLVSPPG